jgi:hypothetical protein
MKRQEWRWFEKLWRKIKCFSRCDGFASHAKLRNTAVDVQIKVCDDMLFEFNLDMFRRWRLYPVLVVRGFPFRCFCYPVSVASDEWLEEYFGHDDSDFEPYLWLGCE